ncbi:DNA repair protein RecO [Christensenellaceae bacterium OttesenSCG-928-M15]|nr:DNA repair protein RecO [Christensenellaceae bacterium OttesenSCG-928-M15]
MAQHMRVHGIVTRYVNYKDNDRILTIFTKECGRMDAKARGCRREKSPLLACAQPFVYGEFLLYSSKNHAAVNQCDIRESFYPLRENYWKLSAASAMLNLCQQAIQEGEPNEELFSLLYYSLSFLSYGQADPVDLTLCFLIRYFERVGLCPHIIHCSKCAKDLRTEKELYFSASAGGALCKSCGGGFPVSPLALEALRRMLLLENANMDDVKLPFTLRKELFRLLERYAEYQLERENKPLEALKNRLTMEE